MGDIALRQGEFAHGRALLGRAAQLDGTHRACSTYMHDSSDSTIERACSSVPGQRQPEVIKELALRLIAAHHDLDNICAALVRVLTSSLCDSCTVVLVPAGEGEQPPTSSGDHHLTLPLIGTARLRGVVDLTRAGGPAFDADDIAAIEACIACASVAADSALELGAQRSDLRVEQERTAQYHRDMLGLVGHDLRAPLAGIMVGTEILATSHKDDPSVFDTVTRIVLFAKRMTRMVDQMLDMTRAQLAGGIPLARSCTRLSPLIESAIADQARTSPGNHFELLGASELEGVWDPERLNQVASNLLSNAVRYGLEGGPINIEMSQSAGATIITVHNEVREGPIPPHTLETLFEPYRRGEEDYLSGGLGLGLYIAREIVRAHGGSVAVDSSASGTTFRVVLPGRAA